MKWWLIESNARGWCKKTFCTILTFFSKLGIAYLIHTYFWPSKNPFSLLISFYFNVWTSWISTVRFKILYLFKRYHDSYEYRVNNSTMSWYDGFVKQIRTEIGNKLEPKLELKSEMKSEPKSERNLLVVLHDFSEFWSSSVC